MAVLREIKRGIAETTQDRYHRRMRNRHMLFYASPGPVIRRSWFVSMACMVRLYSVATPCGVLCYYHFFCGKVA